MKRTINQLWTAKTFKKILNTMVYKTPIFLKTLERQKNILARALKQILCSKGADMSQLQRLTTLLKFTKKESQKPDSERYWWLCLWYPKSYFVDCSQYFHTKTLNLEWVYVSYLFFSISVSFWLSTALQMHWSSQNGILD